MKKNRFIILGINFSGGHDSSAALMINGKLKCAYEEERFNLEKHTNKFPKASIEACLKNYNIKKQEIDLVCHGFDQKKLIKEKYLGMAIKDERYIKVLVNDIEKIKKALIHENTIKNYFPNTKIKIFDHYDCHHASVYFPSGLKKSLLVSYDGKGEFDCSSIKFAKGNKFQDLQLSDKYPHSLGYIYAAITFYLGWKFFCDEGIIMGLAPYGNPNAKIKGKKIIDTFREIIKIRNNNVHIDENWISYNFQRDKWVSDKFIKHFGKHRKPGSKIKKNHKDIAAALQKRLEEVVIKIIRNLRKKFNIENLCFSGGVALNCSLNGKILEKKIFDKFYVHPGSGDQGHAIGACYLGHLTKYPNFKFEKNNNYYLGSSYDQTLLNKSINKFKKKIKIVNTNNIFKKSATYLKDGMIGAIFNGRSEFGPRALGNRSIICKPYPRRMKDYLNKKVKFRENFRPFAPIVLDIFQSKYFNFSKESPHMLYAIKTKKKFQNEISATVHVDGTSRVQTVTQNNNNNLYKILEEFHNITKVPVLLNTSFNVKGQPIVDNPESALKTFLKTKIDFLILDKYLIIKN